MTTEDTPPPVLVGGVVTLSDVDLYQQCTTTVEDFCDVDPVLGVCFTGDIVLNATEVSTT